MQVFRLLARRRLTQTTIASISLVAATLALSPASAFAAPSPLVVVQPQAADAQTGRTYGEWSALWWQTMLKLTNDRSPVLDTTGRNCSLGDTPDMFFLAGNAGGAVTRTCSVPAGKPLFIPILNTECSTVEAPPFFGRNDDELHACARALIDGVDPRTLSATLDGVPVADLARFRAPSPVYGFSMPAENNFLGLSGVTGGRSAADGYYVLLAPPVPGQHTIRVGGSVVSGPAAGFSVSVTYHLSVEAPTFASLCSLSRQFVGHTGMSTGMCAVLSAARLNDRLHVPQGKAGELGAYRSMVAAAAQAHFISAEHAASLTRLSALL